MQRAFFTGVLGSVAAFGLLAASGSAFAASTWDLSSGCSVVGGGSCLQDNNGSSSLPSLTYQFTSNDGKIIQAAAFHSASNAGTSTLAADFLGFYGGNGLGVGNSAAPQHAVNNSSGDDFVVFKFPNATWNVTQLILSAFGTANLKMNTTIFFGTPTGALSGITGLSSFAGVKLSDLETAANGFSQESLAANSGAGAANQTITPSPADSGNNDLYLIVAASLTDGTTTDTFKVNSVTGVQGTSVVEPSSLALLVAGAAGIYIRRRRGKDAPAAA